MFVVECTLIFICLCTYLWSRWSRWSFRSCRSNSSWLTFFARWSFLTDCTYLIGLHSKKIGHFNLPFLNAEKRISVSLYANTTWRLKQNRIKIADNKEAREFMRIFILSLRCAHFKILLQWHTNRSPQKCDCDCGRFFWCSCCNFDLTVYKRIYKHICDSTWILVQCLRVCIQRAWQKSRFLKRIYHDRHVTWTLIKRFWKTDNKLRTQMYT